MKNIHLFNKDVTKYSFDKQKNYNYILFIDILEHIKEDYKFIDSISHYFTDNTKICISIPMKNYKYVVGEKAHK
ncbi:MAG: hypothetical protein LBC61_07125 [Candidatus Peribacteria bacterium]|jgi:2-polyprenyl-3-methyl-5-hydroxy-6-metoxy-1,4-benzoquinol methylase|nr:hypothetical protein [Candidatus Peribacteria bacterium]